MELTEKPLVHSWMSDKEKGLRSNVGAIMHALPDISFFDKDSFAVEGFISERSTSVVCKVKDSSGEYIAKTSSNDQIITAEAEALKRWQAAGANVVTVVDFIKPTDNSPAIEVLEFVEGGTSVSHLEDDDIDIKELYSKLGMALSKLHKVKVPGFGKIKVEPDFRGEKETLGEVLDLELPDTMLQKLIEAEAAIEKDKRALKVAKEILVKDLSDNRQGVLCHSDPGLHNTFGIAEIKFFDPTPEVLHPMMDLGMAMLWASMIYHDSELAMDGLLEGYKVEGHFNQRSFDAALYFQTISRYDWWLERGKHEPEVLNRITQTKGILDNARENLLKGTGDND